MESLLLFSKRENEVLNKLFAGYNTREIAHELQISEFTVRIHRRRILEKTSCKNTAQLYLYVMAKNSLATI